MGQEPGPGTLQPAPTKAAPVTPALWLQSDQAAPLGGSLCSRPRPLQALLLGPLVDLSDLRVQGLHWPQSPPVPAQSRFTHGPSGVEVIGFL